MEHLTRRKLIVTGLAGTGALAVAALPAIAVSAGSDAKLLQLCRNYLRLDRANDRASLRQDDLETQAREKRQLREARQKQKPTPSRPAELTGDFDVWPEAAGPFGLVSLTGKDVRKVLSELAEGTRTLPSILMPRGSVPADVQWVPPPERARIKARELLAVYDEWAAKGGGEPKPKRERRSSAVVKAERAVHRLYRMQEATAAAIAALPAQTMAGIRAKLHVTTANPVYVDGRDQFGSDYPPLVAIGASVMRDIGRIDISARVNPPIAA
jgi:hypothetical protein